MKLKDYMEQYVGAKELAKRVGCSVPALYNYANGREPRLTIALKIIRATKGKVRLVDLAQESQG